MLMLRRSGTLLIGIALVATAVMPVTSVAQDDANDVPLGDVARNLRQKAPTRPVIDDDNFAQVMQQAESRKGFGSSLRFLMVGEANGFQVAVPDATCSLSFSANAKSLLSGQYAQMELPPADVGKLEGRATIEGDALTLPLHNDTDWHVSEVTVALTVVRKHPPVGESSNGLMPSGLPDSLGTEVRPERKPDTTVIYRMRAAAAPFATTVFSTPLKLDLNSEDEWHWAIVAAKGYPPQSYSANVSPAPTAQPSQISIPSLADFEGPTEPQEKPQR
jgi:hypothetical protein